MKPNFKNFTKFYKVKRGSTEDSTVRIQTPLFFANSTSFKSYIFSTMRIDTLSPEVCAQLARELFSKDTGYKNKTNDANSEIVVHDIQQSR